MKKREAVIAGLLVIQGAIRKPGTNMKDIRILAVLRWNNAQLMKVIAIRTLSVMVLLYVSATVVLLPLRIALANSINAQAVANSLLDPIG